jgi:hypothetical protein
VLRIKGGSNRIADYLIVFQSRMALRDGQKPRAVLRDNPVVREQVINDCEELHSHLPVAKARELGSFIYDGLILQLRSMGPGLLVDRWIRQHCPDLQEDQEHAIASEITNNLGALEPSTRANYPGALYQASTSMNAAYALFGGDLLGKPYLAVPYFSQGYGEKARRLIALALPPEGPRRCGGWHRWLCRGQRAAGTSGTADRLSCCGIWVPRYSDWSPRGHLLFRARSRSYRSAIFRSEGFCPRTPPRMLVAR